MPTKGQRKCPVCEKYFEPVEGQYEIYHNRYYHKECLESYKIRMADITDGTVKGPDVADSEWIDAAYRYLKYSLKTKVNYIKYTRQWEGFLKKKMTSENIYYAIRYFYEVQKGDVDKGNGGIGIVPYVYDDSIAFWAQHDALKAKIAVEVGGQLKRTYNKPDANIISANKQKYNNPLKSVIPKIDLSGVDLSEEADND